MRMQKPTDRAQKGAANMVASTRDFNITQLFQRFETSTSQLVDVSILRDRCRRQNSCWQTGLGVYEEGYWQDTGCGPKCSEQLLCTPDGRTKA